MRNTIRLILMVAALLAIVAAPALAQFTIGGHDEQSEWYGAFWLTAAPSPGAVVGSGGAAPHLLISEVVMTPTAGEFIEICNSTSEPIDLTDVYLSDDWWTGVTPPACYCRLPEAGYAAGVHVSDFIVRFPPGTLIPAGGVYVIAVDGSGFALTYGFTADFEIMSTDATPDMIPLGGGAGGAGGALITNSNENVSLFYWDGIADNVCDIDYVQWAASSSGNEVDKTNIAVDGPDADALASPYLPDLPAGLQAFAPSAAAGFSLTRGQCDEAGELPASNGCIGGGPTPTKRGTWGELKIHYR